MAEYKARYGECTKAGKVERAMMQLMADGDLGSGVMRQYLDAADEESLARLYDLLRR